MRATAHALVPVKGFTDAKSRLAEALDDDTRRELAKALATRSVRVLVAERPTTVVAHDDDALDLAASLGATPFRCSGPGLDLAAREGVAELTRLGVERTIIVHSDLPLLDTVTDLDVEAGMAIATDRHGHGTNVMSIANGTDLRWAYGAGSLHRHRAEALRLGLAVTRVNRHELSFDLDTIADLRVLLGHAGIADIITQLLTDSACSGAS